MNTLLQHPVFKSALGLGLGFLGAFLGVFVSRVYLSNNVETNVLDIILGVNVLTALIVVLAVEGFTSAVPTNVVQPLPLMKNMILISVIFTVSIGSVFLITFSFLDGYFFLQEYWWLGFISLFIIVAVGAGQMLESAAAVVGKNNVIVWRRTSVQFIGLGVFILLTVLTLVNDGNVLFVWFVSVLLGGLVAFFTSWVWLFYNEEKVKNVSFRKTWAIVMPKYFYHHMSKLGIVLPRFIIPVIILALFGLEFNTSFVILWTVLGFLSMIISAVSRGYMSHHGLDNSWSIAWKTWGIFFVLPALLIFVFNKEVVGLFGDNFNDLGVLLQVGLVSMVFYSFVDFILARLRVEGAVRLSSVVSVVSGIVLVGLVILSGSLFGLFGVMLAYVVVYVLFAFILFIMFMFHKRNNVLSDN